MPHWFFDHNRGDCQAFYYSGCGGNGNNFLHYEDCVAFCSRSRFLINTTINMISREYVVINNKTFRCVCMYAGNLANYGDLLSTVYVLLV